MFDWFFVACEKEFKSLLKIHLKILEIKREKNGNPFFSVLAARPNLPSGPVQQCRRFFLGRGQGPAVSSSPPPFFPWPLTSGIQEPASPSSSSSRTQIRSRAWASVHESCVHTMPSPYKSRACARIAFFPTLAIAAFAFRARSGSRNPSQPLLPSIAPPRRSFAPVSSRTSSP